MANGNNKHSTTVKDKIKKILQDYMLTDLTLNNATQQILCLFSVSGSFSCDIDKNCKDPSMFPKCGSCVYLIPNDR